MRNISSSNFIICLGDDVRYRFAQELMPEGHLINTNSLKIKKSYVFMHSDEENIITDDKKIMVYPSKPVKEDFMDCVLALLQSDSAPN